jgi:hypothetical protein
MKGVIMRELEKIRKNLVNLVGVYRDKELDAVISFLSDVVEIASDLADVGALDSFGSEIGDAWDLHLGHIYGDLHDRIV